MIRHRGLLFALAMLALAGTVRANDGPQREFLEIERAYVEAQQSFYAEMERLHKAGKLDPTSMPKGPEHEFTPRVLAFAKDHAGKSAAVPALSWLVQNPLMGPMGPQKEHPQWAMDQLIAKHTADPAIKDLLPVLQYGGWVVGNARIIELCEAVAKATKDPEMRAAANFSLAIALNGNVFEGPGPDPARALKLFKAIAAERPKSDRGRAAAAYVFEAEHLQVGMKAPEIEGMDLDGKKVLLSQFLGQVVVLDFWGFW